MPKVPNTRGTVMRPQSLGRQNIDAPIEAFGGGSGLQQLGAGVASIGGGLQKIGAEQDRERKEQEKKQSRAKIQQAAELEREKQKRNSLELQNERSKMREEVAEAYNQHVVDHRGAKSPEAYDAWKAKYKAIASKYGNELTGDSRALFDIFVRDEGVSRGSAMRRWLEAEVDKHTVNTNSAEHAAADRKMEDLISAGTASADRIRRLVADNTASRSHADRTLVDRFNEGAGWIREKNIKNSKRDATISANTISREWRERGFTAQQAIDSLEKLDTLVDTKPLRDKLVVEATVDKAVEAVNNAERPEDMSQGKFRAQIVDEVRAFADSVPLNSEQKFALKRTIEQRVKFEWEQQDLKAAVAKYDTLTEFSQTLAGKTETQQAVITEQFVDTYPMLIREAKQIATAFNKPDQPGVVSAIDEVLIDSDLSVERKKKKTEQILDAMEASGKLRIDTQKKLIALEDERIQKQSKEAFRQMGIIAATEGVDIEVNKWNDPALENEWKKMKDHLSDSAIQYFMRKPEGTVSEFIDLFREDIIKKDSYKSRDALEKSIKFLEDQRLKTEKVLQERGDREKAERILKRKK